MEILKILEQKQHNRDTRFKLSSDEIVSINTTSKAYILFAILNNKYLIE
jgi:hypothetical protein